MQARVKSVGPLKDFELDGKHYVFREILFDTGGDRELMTVMWGDKEPPVEGDDVEIFVEVTSERNRKNPDIWWHKVKLKSFTSKNYAW